MTRCSGRGAIDAQLADDAFSAQVSNASADGAPGTALCADPRGEAMQTAHCRARRTTVIGTIGVGDVEAGDLTLLDGTSARVGEGGRGSKRTRVGFVDSRHKVCRALVVVLLPRGGDKSGASGERG